MWYKFLAIIFLFFLFAVLQTSFFAHFSFFGETPNLIFALYFLLVFFAKDFGCATIIFGALAGALLDFVLGKELGVSIILLAIIGFLAKKTQISLNEQDDKFPFAYFLPLFLLWFLAYSIFSSLPALNFSWHLLAETIYTSVFAIAGFYVAKNFLAGK